MNNDLTFAPIYKSHKLVKAIPMTRLDWCTYRGWTLPDDEDGDDEGYIVEYLDGGKPNHSDHNGYISWSPKEQFDNGYLPDDKKGKKTLHNSTVSGAKVNVSDLIVYGNGDTFKLICKASSKKENWMKSTKAMHIPGVGCIVQVTTQQGDNIAEALTFAPGTCIKLIDPDDKSKGRKLVHRNI